MKQKTWLIHYLQLLAIAGIATFIFLTITSWSQSVHALPEYAKRTGESCATCHVNPGGGGPRTLRGALWAARGKPNEVPVLPGVLLAPSVTDGAELFEIACSTCHGVHGDGLFGKEIANSGLKDNKIRANILSGRLQSGMPSFDGKFTKTQLQALVDYVVALANGTAEIPPLEYPLESPAFNCSAQFPSSSCGGN
ncbi:MAG: cytochrome c [Anaerolineales bacterium]|nr:cytochrome c [Anaerolineales bacterium]MDP2778550.1 cytochrome c [Anaerolineales bacterium]